MTNADKVVAKAIENCRSIFDRIDKTSEYNQKKVLDAFRKNRVAVRHFAPTLGYGYDDVGRDTLQALFADVFCCEDAIVSPHIATGTHAIYLALSGMLMPGQKALSITGNPYDTLHDAINGENIGSLKDYGIEFDVVALKDNAVDMAAVKKKLSANTYDLVYFQRSRGYDLRGAFTAEEFADIAKTIKSLTAAPILVDNCYGEFTSEIEPTEVGADVIAGSLIKNAGGGIAPTGGYICGKKSLIGKIENRFTVPGIGREVGSYAGDYRLFYQGLFVAPHVVAQALKSAVLFSSVFSSMGYKTLPAVNDSLGDIVCSIVFDDKDKLLKFCESIQAASPIDSFVTPEPWAMPGYEDQVVMAAGAFVQGSSIELSADAPIKPPYVCYVQGGITFEHSIIALKECLQNLT